MIFNTSVMSKFQALLIILIVITISGCSSDDLSFNNDWDEDVYFFSENIKEKHVDLFFNISESEFDKDIETLRNNTASNSETKTIIELLKILSKVGDSHTQMQYSSKLTSLPFSTKWLDDGIFLTEVDINNEQHLGSRIIGINDTPIEDVIDNFRKVISYENESNYKNQFIEYMKYIDFYNDFGISDSSNEIAINLDNGISYNVASDATQTLSIQSNNPPLFLKDTQTFYWFEELKEDKIMYIQYNLCRERDDLSFQSFTDQIVSRIENNDHIEKLVIDLRHNGGGNSSIIRPLISEIKNYIYNNRFQTNDIYVIIGRKTFSSAVLNTTELKDLYQVVVIGEPTGGKPNHHGEVLNFRLPNSLLNVSYSTKYFKFSPTDDDAIYPDVSIEYNSDDLLNEIDPILEKIKND